jgi:hypothetical protein
MKKNKKKRGGVRPGAGRKALFGENMVKITVRIPVYQRTHLDSQGTDRSKALRDILDKEIEK